MILGNISSRTCPLVFDIVFIFTLSYTDYDDNVVCFCLFVKYILAINAFDLKAGLELFIHIIAVIMMCSFNSFPDRLPLPEYLINSDFFRTILTLYHTIAVLYLAILTL